MSYSTILQFTITKILGDSDTCANSVYHAAFLPSLGPGIEASYSYSLLGKIYDFFALLRINWLWT